MTKPKLLKSPRQKNRNNRVKKSKQKCFSRPPLERMHRIHQELRAKHFPNCRKLGEMLEVSPKTIQRDIEFMRDQKKLPIEYDQLHLGFYYSEPVTNLPNVEVTEGEVIALFVAQKALAQYKNTSFEKPLKNAFQKISDGLCDTIAFDWDELNAGISFKGIGTTVADIADFETISNAVLRRCELRFQYKKLNATRYESRHVQPYHLGCIENQWYLFAHDLARDQMRTFVLARMRRIQNTGARFSRPADFSIAEYLGGSFGVFTQKNNVRHKIKIRFDAFAARLAGERKWHASQKNRPLANGELEMTMTLGGFEEIERWILSWGIHARVLEPKQLADRIRKISLTVSAF